MHDADPAATTTSQPDLSAARRAAAGSAIRSAREAAGRKPKEIADIIGVSPSAMTGIESGEREASLPQIEVIAHYLRVPVHTLLGTQAPAAPETSVGNYDEIIRLRGHIIGARLETGAHGAR